MSTRKHLALLTAAVALGSGLAIAPAAQAITGNVSTTTASSSAAKAAGEVSPLVTCDYGYFCAYSGTNFTGSVIKMYECKSYTIPWSGNGSWINNQSTGTKAKMYGAGGNLIYTTPGAYSSDSSGDWTSVYNVRNC
jgi:Peptidase inhibitor family I36